VKGKTAPDHWLDEARNLCLDLKALDVRKRAVSATFAFKALRLVTLFRAMDNWMSDGEGLESLPRAWRPQVVGPEKVKTRRNRR
jgi:hypothetical protein